jgi:hypothetical protein
MSSSSCSIYLHKEHMVPRVAFFYETGGGGPLLSFLLPSKKSNKSTKGNKIQFAITSWLAMTPCLGVKIYLLYG